MADWKISFAVRTFLIFAALGSSAVSVADPLPAAVPAPKDNAVTSEKVELGKALYFDGRLSSTGKVSCNSCHDVSGSGTDNKQFSEGINGLKGGRNAPTVWNAAYQSVQFWDGRAPTLEEQAKGPIVNPVEMGMANHQVVVDNLKKIPGYVTAFKKAFPQSGEITIDAVAQAIASYERTLVTPKSPYDRFRGGDMKAMSASAQRGMTLAKTIGCMSCHLGPMFSGPALPVGTGFYQKFPVHADEKLEAMYGFSKDLGRYEVTKKAADKNFWRVPTWRNVELTAPYFHNGSVNDLAEAVRVMAKTQLNKTLRPAQVSDLVEFLKSLTGERPAQTPPVLPM